MKNYKGEVIHFMGGANEYVGEMQYGPGAGVHPLGANWIRIKNPCKAQEQMNPDTKTIGLMLVALSGPAQIFKPFVDIRIPDSSGMEVLFLDPKGNLYKNYKAAIEQKAPSRIILPGPGAIGRMPSVH